MGLNITCKNDITLGMILNVKEQQNFEASGRQVVVYSLHGFNDCVHIIDKRGEKHYYNIRSFKEYKGYKEVKQMSKVEDWKLVRPFDVSDLFFTGDKTCVEFQFEFKALLDEYVYKTNITNQPGMVKDNYDLIFTTIEEVFKYKTLVKYLYYLNQKGFIKKNSQVLKLGMYLTDGGSSLVYEIVSICDSHYAICLEMMMVLVIY